MRYIIKYNYSHNYYNDDQNYPNTISEEKEVNSFKEAKEWCANFLSKAIIFRKNHRLFLGTGWEICYHNIEGIYPVNSNRYTNELELEIAENAKTIAENEIKRLEESWKKSIEKETQRAKEEQDKREFEQYLKLKEKFENNK